jgi:hypothetical protein
VSIAIIRADSSKKHVLVAVTVVVIIIIMRWEQLSALVFTAA